MKNSFKKYFFYLLLLIFFISIPLKFSSSYSYKYSDSSHIIVHFIDVGQGDCILITTNNSNTLIDSGPSTSRKKLLKYLDSLNINKFDYVIATHPHEDHIGNMDAIIRKYTINNFYAPKITSSSITFENMVTALNDKNIKIIPISNGSNSINLGDYTSINFYTLPNLNTVDNLNLFSPIIKFTFKNISFLFTGDAEFENEQYLINTDVNLHADILKIGHHGSSSSTSEEFLTSVSPKVAIISVGEDNSYGHPAESTLNLLNKYHINTFRTDLSGNIIITSDGSTFSVSIKKENER